MKDFIICPKTKNLVDADICLALRNLPKITAEFFTRKICTTVAGCPKEDYCAVFESGWSSVGEFLELTMKE
jgi:uncharacterized membrane-anchored protein